MKLQIIETPDYILAVSDEEIKEGDYCTSEKNIVDVGKIHNSYTIFKPSTKEHLAMLRSCVKIIAHQPKIINEELEKYAPELDLPLLKFENGEYFL